ncbi:MAG: hypothetical protein KKI02_04175, partial [Planctomycetes bacterium]|nr:hypothetical protein [Planctomycetota bacterium]
MGKDVSQQQIEDLTVRLGNEMFDRMENSKPWITQLQWWMDWGLAQCMRNERLKIQAFRFIDILPTVGQNQAEMARHMKEYFVLPEQARNGHGDARRERAEALKSLEVDGGVCQLDQLVSKIMDFKRLDSVRPRLLCWIAWKTSMMMAGQFIAGANTEQAERAIRRLRKQQLAFTIDVLGEAARSAKEALKYQEIYLDLISELPKHAAAWEPVPLVDGVGDEAVPRVNVSIKL